LTYDIGIAKRRLIIPPDETYFAVPRASVYQGPGDIASAIAWWGLRAYNLANAIAGTAAIRIQRPDTAQSDIPVLPNGKLNTGLAFFTGGPYTVVTFYDQTGNGNHLQPSTAPTFVLTGNGLTVPNLSFVSASSQFLQVTPFFPLTPLPYTLNLVANHTASAAQSNTMQISNSGASNSAGLGYRSSANNQAWFFDGTNLPVAAANDGTWNTLTASTAGSSITGTIFAVNASQATSTNVGAISVGGTPSGNMLVPNIAQPFDGFIAELGVWMTAFSSGQITALYNQQSTYYGVF
jgi:hypothetical protein